jgi:hypothetical protein
MPGRNRLTAGLAAPDRQSFPYLHLAAFMPYGHPNPCKIKQHYFTHNASLYVALFRHFLYIY